MVFSMKNRYIHTLLAWNGGEPLNDLPISNYS